jgi:hypothetical protein
VVGHAIALSRLWAGGDIAYVGKYIFSLAAAVWGNVKNALAARFVGCECVRRGVRFFRQEG